jgi:hypothetical protein
VTTERLELFPGWESHDRLSPLFWLRPGYRHGRRVKGLEGAPLLEHAYKVAARGERPARERSWGQLMTENVDPNGLSALASVVEERGWVLEIEAMRIASATGARRV